MEDPLFGKPARNFAPATIWTGDNLDILRGINSETVDLIYLDPPFNSNRTYSAPIGSKAAGAAFEDTWTLDKEDVAWMGLIADQHPAIHSVVTAAGDAHSTGMQSYLRMMTVRLLEMRRVLAPTGSIYLHCDPTASHFLKVMMDAIFGPRCFRSEIIWKRTSAHNDAKVLGSVHDTILHYSVSEKKWIWNRGYQAHDPNYVASHYRRTTEDGRRFRTDNVTAMGLSGGGYTYEWNGVTKVWRYPRDRMQQLHDEGRLYYTSKGTPEYIRYLNESKGVSLQSVWTDVSPINSRAKERIGYPTQKPLALLNRIIEASSNPGDVVLDPFCGCATACVAADNLQREWVGIDISPKAVELVHMRLRDALGELYHAGMVTARTDIPQRTDIEAPINYRQNRHVLFGEQEGKCNGCQMNSPSRCSRLTTRCRAAVAVPTTRATCNCCAARATESKGTGPWNT